MKNLILKALNLGLIVVFTFLTTVASAVPLSPQAEEGKLGFVLCNACHNPELDPALAPPMWGLQRRYSRISGSKEQFVNSIVSFVKNPDETKAIMRQAVKQLGLMPAQDLPVEHLENIATYIYEETFQPPCTHWRSNIKKAEAESHVDGHIEKEKRQVRRFCR